MPKLIALLLLAIAAFSISSLVSDATYMASDLPGGIPLGNAFAAVGLCSLAGAAVLLSPTHSIRRRASQASLAAAVFWLPVSVGLAGNLALNFSGSRGAAWLVLSLATVIAVVGSLALAIAGSLLGFFRRAGSP